MPGIIVRAGSKVLKSMLFIVQSGTMKYGKISRDIRNRESRKV